MSVTIEPVSDSQGREVFLDFAERCYEADSPRVTPLRAQDRWRLRPGAPFFRHADLVLLLARRDGGVCGTISVMLDRTHNELKQEAVAFFGFFECDGEADTVAALMGAAREQARAWGCETLRGPRNLSRIEETGLLVEGFDTRSPMLTGHHPPHYRGLIEAEGFEKHHDVLAYEIALRDEDGDLRPLPRKLAQQADSVDVDGLVVRSIGWHRVLADLRLAHAVFVDAFRDVPENTPMSLRQFTGVGLGFLAATNRHMLQLATVHGKPAGFALCFPELHGAIVHAHGRLGPSGLIGLAGGLRTMDTASFKLLGVLPMYRGAGLHALLIREAIYGVARAGYQRLEASLIDERNAPMRSIVEGAGMEIYKRFRIYEQAI